MPVAEQQSRMGQQAAGAAQPTTHHAHLRVVVKHLDGTVEASRIQN